MYLQEHIIHVWEETGADFHNCLIQLYCEKVQGLMKEYLSSFPAGMSNLFWWEDQEYGRAQGSLHIPYCNPSLLRSSIRYISDGGNWKTCGFVGQSSLLPVKRSFKGPSNTLFITKSNGSQCSLTSAC